MDGPEGTEAAPGSEKRKLYGAFQNYKTHLVFLIEYIYSLILDIAKPKDPGDPHVPTKIPTSVLPQTQPGPVTHVARVSVTPPSFSGTSSVPAAFDPLGADACPTRRTPYSPMCACWESPKKFWFLDERHSPQKDDTVCKELGESWTTEQGYYKLLDFLQR